MDWRPTIVIVDDQPDNSLILEDLLSRRYRTRSLGSGQRLFQELAAGAPPDLILLDVVMPEMDGFDVCRRLKADPRTSGIPVIFLTGLDRAEDEELGLSLGADDFIHKPFVAGVVLARVGNLLGRREAEERRRQMAVMEARMTEQEKAAEALQAAVDKLTAMNIELERIAVIAAHDLREPARTLSTFGALLQRRCAPKLAGEELEWLGYMVAGATRLYELIGGLLEYSRRPATAGEPRTVSSARACAAAIADLGALIAENGAVVAAEDLPDVLGDETLLLQVFQNLIGNALKFRHPDRPPRVSVTAEPAGAKWHFSISDNGRGFDAGDQDVFELFRQAGPYQDRKGAGLGLAICRRIIQQLGGTVWATSVPGRGSTFGFSLPAPPEIHQRS